MADSKISTLAAITSLAAADQLAVAHSGASNSLRADHLTGFELDYAQITGGTTTITSTADGTSGGTSLIAGASVAYDGATIVVIEVYIPRLVVNAATAGHSGFINLYEGTTDLGRIAELTSPTTGQNLSVTVLGRRKLTPSNASHTYTIRGWKDAAGDTVSIICGAGGASALMPAYMRITVA